jgi:hypothetical protein
VLDTRASADETVITRRRGCPCGYRWRTHEEQDGKGEMVALSPWVQKKANAKHLHPRLKGGAPTTNGHVDNRRSPTNGGSPKNGPPTNSANPPTNWVGGVGGGLSGDRLSGSLSDQNGSVPDRIPSLSPDQGVDPARAKRQRRTEESASFAAWYAEYPRKVGRTKAAAAWAKFELDARADAVMVALRAQLAHYRARPIEKVPHPTTWLNEGRWNDDPAAYAVNGTHRDVTKGWAEPSKNHPGGVQEI